MQKQASHGSSIPSLLTADYLSLPAHRLFFDIFPKIAYTVSDKHKQNSMGSLYSFHREENKKTKELSQLIDQLHVEPTDVEGQTINIFTLVWTLLKDENYFALVACKTSAQLKKLLSSEVVKILKGKSHTYSLNPGNYTALKSELNHFFKYLLHIADYYHQHRIFINREKINKELKSKDPSFPLLLRQDQVSFRLQRIISLPKLMLKGAYETNRIEISFENKKMLDDFILFVVKGVAETSNVLQHTQTRISDFANFVKRRKEVVVPLLLITLTTLLVPFLPPLPSPNVSTSVVTNQNAAEANLVDLTDISYNAKYHSLVLTFQNTKSWAVTIQSIRLLTPAGERSFVPDNSVLMPFEKQTELLHNVILQGNETLIIDFTDAYGGVQHLVAAL